MASVAVLFVRTVEFDYIKTKTSQGTDVSSASWKLTVAHTKESIIHVGPNVMNQNLVCFKKKQMYYSHGLIILKNKVNTTNLFKTTMEKNDFNTSTLKRQTELFYDSFIVF